MEEWIDGWMEGWIDGWMEGWIDGWMERWFEQTVFTPTIIITAIITISTITTMTLLSFSPIHRYRADQGDVGGGGGAMEWDGGGWRIEPTHSPCS